MSNTDQQDNDRRLATRVQLKLSTSILLVKIDAYYSGVIANLSQGGCYFPIDEELPLGEKCQIEILVGEGLKENSISMSGRVARVDNHGAGIEFIDNPPESTAALKNLLSCYSATRSE